MSDNSDVQAMNNNPKNKSSGFTLIEISIVIVIASLLLAGGMNVLKVHMLSKTMQDTKDRIEQIKAAMVIFKEQRGRLPCPAAMNAPPGSPNFGIEDSSACAGGTPPTTWTGTTVRVQNPATAGTGNPPATGGLTVRIGAVPFATLGISPQASVDGWNDRFLYAVSERLADATVPYDQRNGAITLIDNASPTPNVLGANPNHMPFILISMGPSGHGSYTYHGVPRGGALCVAGPQQENCDMANATFRSMDYSTSLDDAARFDNILANDLGAANPFRICGDQGMLYGPGHSRADGNGCVPDMIEAANGNVGIGTAAPVARLDVQGEVKVSNSGAACTAPRAGSIRNNPATNLIEYCSPSAGLGNVPAWVPLMPAPVLNGYAGPDLSHCYGTSICNPRPFSAHSYNGGTCTPQERGMSKLMSALTASKDGDLVFTDGIYFCLCGTTNFNSDIECSWIGTQSTPNDGPP